jgi:hypothetical protein
VIALVRRRWHSLSPALRRYHRASALPCVVFAALAAVHEAVSRQPGVSASLRLFVALAPVACLAWLFTLYLRFLRDCDELERRIELGALAWAAGIVLHVCMACMLLLDAGVASWQPKDVAAGAALLTLLSYALVRARLHRRYA